MMHTPAHKYVPPKPDVTNQDKPLGYMIDDYKRCVTEKSESVDECKHRWWGFGESDLITCIHCGKTETT